MPASLPTVFVSATSSDLAVCRLVATQALLASGIHPVAQEHLPPDHRELVEALGAEIRGCDAVICLVGTTFGAAPRREDGAPPRSYTQIEYDIAQELGKPTYVFLTQSRAALNSSASEPEELRRLQAAHRDALLERHKV